MLVEDVPVVKLYFMMRSGLDISTYRGSPSAADVLSSTSVAVSSNSTSLGSWSLVRQMPLDVCLAYLVWPTYYGQRQLPHVIFSQ
jgi:hypothetical protein